MQRQCKQQIGKSSTTHRKELQSTAQESLAQESTAQPTERSFNQQLDVRQEVPRFSEDLVKKLTLKQGLATK